jgi:5-methylcytosine-specific restriction endonuclease McrA
MLKRRKPLRSSQKPIKKLGKIGRYRLKRKAEWVESHPPNHQGYYVCHICKRWVHHTEMELDHVLPKSGTPRDIAEHDNNLKPAHGQAFPPYCNGVKGSRRI